MFGKLLNKILGKEKKPNAGERFAGKLRDKADQFSNFLGDKFSQAQEEFGVMRSKMNNLRETNYNLGLHHLEKGNLSDAIFRFRFIIKFWPDLYDAYYQLAYCLVLNNKPYEAKIVLRDLLSKNPDFDPKARELLDHINESLKQAAPDA